MKEADHAQAKSKYRKSKTNNTKQVKGLQLPNYAKTKINVPITNK